MRQKSVDIEIGVESTFRALKRMFEYIVFRFWSRGLLTGRNPAQT